MVKLEPLCNRNHLRKFISILFADLGLSYGETGIRLYGTLVAEEIFYVLDLKLHACPRPRSWPKDMCPSLSAPY